MSSGGQIVGAIGGAVAGFILSAGNPLGAIKGAAYGAAIGGYIDPPPGPNLRGPTLEDKSFQSAAYGVSIPRLYGTIATMGNIIYLENNEYKAVSKKEKQGGKGGGGGGTYETTTYFATFAVAFAESMPGSNIRRIWAGAKLIYSAAGLGGDDPSVYLPATFASSANADGWRYYDGTQTEPDSRMEASLGVGMCPSYEGTAYLVFYDFDLTEFGNGLAGCPIKVEFSPSIDAQPEWELLAERSIKGNSQVPEVGHYSLKPLSESGLSVRVSTINPPQFQIGMQSLNLRGEATFTIRDNPGAITSPQFVPGYSEVTTYAFINGRETPGEAWYTWYVNTDRDSMPSPFQNDQYAVVDYIKIYDMKALAAPFYLLRAQLIQPVSGFALEPGAWYLWDANDPPEISYRQNHLGVAGETDLLALSGTYYAVFIQRGVLNARVRIIATMDVKVGPGDGVIPKYSVISEYDLQLEDAVNHKTACCIKDDVLYYLANENFLKIGIVDLNKRSVSYKRIVVDAPVGMGTFRSMNIQGKLMCVSVDAADGKQYFYFISMGAIGEDAVLLRDVVNDEFLKCGLWPYEFDLAELGIETVDGYKVSDVASVRAAVTQLQAAYLFDVVERGYQIFAVKRGGEVKAQIAYGELIPKSPRVVEVNFEDAARLPSRYLVSYLDRNREYDVNQQYMDFPSAYFNPRTAELAIVMTADFAAQLTDKLINLSHIESKTFSFSLPHSHLGLGVADIIRLEYLPGRFDLIRIESCSKNSDGTAEVTARRHGYAGYQSSASGSVAEPPQIYIPYVADSNAVLMDIPALLPLADQYGFVAAAYGDEGFNGAALFRSDDGGMVFQKASTFAGEGTLGVALSVLSHDEGLLIDYSGKLRLSVLNGIFPSITEEQMLTGKNYVAYGRDGRWEILQYSGAVNHTDYVELNCFVRGCKGTEWATGLHKSGDTVVLLDDPDNVFVTSDVSSLGIAKEFKTVTVGQNVSVVGSEGFAYRGVNLKPLSPAYADCFRMGSDWHIQIYLRTRYGSSFFYTGVLPQNESVILIDVEFLDALGNVVRLVKSASEKIVYTEAMQLEDFGLLQNSLHLRIYQLSQRVGRGYGLEVLI